MPSNFNDTYIWGNKERGSSRVPSEPSRGALWSPLGALSEPSRGPSEPSRGPSEPSRGPSRGCISPEPSPLGYATGGTLIYQSV